MLQVAVDALELGKRKLAVAAVERTSNTGAPPHPSVSSELYLHRYIYLSALPAQVFRDWNRSPVIDLYVRQLSITVSADDGVHWEKPAPLLGRNDSLGDPSLPPPHSVEPKLVRLDNGIVVLVSGRQGQWVWYTDESALMGAAADAGAGNSPLSADLSAKTRPWASAIWDSFNLLEWHNSALAGSDLGLLFPSVCVKGLPSAPVCSTYYTSVTVLPSTHNGSASLLIAYDRTPNGRDPPTPDAPWGDVVFSVQLTLRKVLLPLLTPVMHATSAPATSAVPPLKEPYPALHGGRFVAGHGSVSNPDPLLDYVWNLETTSTSLQLITVLPVAVTAHPPSAFGGANSLVNSSDATARALGHGTLRVDFGRELAAWLELRSPDLTVAAVAAGCVSMSVGESSTPEFFSPSRLEHSRKGPNVHNASNPLFAGWKTEIPTPYSEPHGRVFRLELNAELFEGLRYGFVHINSSCGTFAPFTITSLSARAQVAPANWAAFAAPGQPVLERAWYVGGYTVKLNLLSDAIGSVLVQRGDRTPKGVFRGFSGDSHVAQATSMAAFGNFALVKSMQEQLGQFDSTYGTYLMYWVISLADYFTATGDVAFVRAMLPYAERKMRRAYNRATPKPGAPVQTRANELYAGWDERFNFAELTPEGKYYPENGYIMCSLYVQASEALADLAEAVGNTTYAKTYHAEAAKMTARVRSGGEAPGHEWWRPLGLHASAHAATAGLINSTEAPLVFAARFNESSKICSFSNFNQ